MNKQLAERVAQAEQLGKELIKTSSAINGYEDFKTTLVDMDLSLTKDKNGTIPLVAYLDKSDVEDVKSYIVGIVNNLVKLEKDKLDKLMPSAAIGKKVV